MPGFAKKKSPSVYGCLHIRTVISNKWILNYPSLAKLYSVKILHDSFLDSQRNNIIQEK